MCDHMCDRMFSDHQIRHHCRRAVSLVIVDGHFVLLESLCGYVQVTMLALSLLGAINIRKENGVNFEGHLQ